MYPKIKPDFVIVKISFRFVKKYPMKKYVLILSGLAIMFLGSCKKDSDSASPSGTDKKTILTAKKWKVSSSIIDPVKDGSTNYLTTCEVDNSHQFNADGTASFDEGTVKCGTDQTYSAKWSFNSNQTKITIIIPDVDTTEYTIVSFADSKMVVSYKDKLGTTTEYKITDTYEPFTTTNPVGAPTIVTSSATAVTANSATLEANVSSIGTSNMSEYGFVYSSVATTPAIGETDVTKISSTTVKSTTGSITNNATGLTATTKYYVRAFATNATGTSYGEVKEFTTLAGSSSSGNITKLIGKKWKLTALTNTFSGQTQDAFSILEACEKDDHLTFIRTGTTSAGTISQDQKELCEDEEPITTPDTWTLSSNGSELSITKEGDVTNQIIISVTSTTLILEETYELTGVGQVVARSTFTAQP